MEEGMNGRKTEGLKERREGGSKKIEREGGKVEGETRKERKELFIQHQKPLPLCVAFIPPSTLPFFYSPRVEFHTYLHCLG